MFTTFDRWKVQSSRYMSQVNIQKHVILVWKFLSFSFFNKILKFLKKNPIKFDMHLLDID